ncbi:hypothetical protein [Streptomyces sp. NPDC003395]
MSTVLAITALAVYLAVIIVLTIAWPHGIRQHPTAQHLADTQPATVALYLAVLTVAWPAIGIYTLLTYLTRRSTR